LTFWYSIIEKLNPDQPKSLDQFVEQIYHGKILNEIEKLMFDRAHKARFLVANKFDIKKALEHFKEYLLWRKNSKIDNLLVSTYSFSYYHRSMSLLSTIR
jgi:hypothetical protein